MKSCSKLLGCGFCYLVLLVTAIDASCANEKYLLSYKDREGQIWGRAGKVVYVVKNVEAGAIVTADCLSQKEVSEKVIPLGTISDPIDAIGKAAIYRLIKGQLLNKTDLKLAPVDDLNISTRRLTLMLSQSSRQKLKELARVKGISESLLAKMLLEEKIENLARSVNKR